LWRVSRAACQGCQRMHACASAQSIRFASHVHLLHSRGRNSSPLLCVLGARMHVCLHPPAGHPFEAGVHVSRPAAAARRGGRGAAAAERVCSRAHAAVVRAHTLADAGRQAGAC
jgi:hypothetical protein